MKFTTEERETLSVALEALMRRLRDDVHPRADRAEHYNPSAARRYYLAEALRERIEVEL